MVDLQVPERSRPEEAGTQTVVFLHGLGVGPDSWEPQLNDPPPGFRGIAPRITGLSTAESEPFSLECVTGDLLAMLDDQGLDRVHLCGLSLGAVIAARFAARHPHRVASLILSGGQVHPNPTLMRLQDIVIRMLPQIFFRSGVSKQAMLSVLGEIAAVDLRPDLPLIRARTLVLCGSRDRANIGAARQLNAAIPDSDLVIVPGAGHTWNTQMPEVFNATLSAFLTGRSMTLP